MTEHDSDEAIATYLVELRAEAELARGDLDEIADHLSSLASELRTTGMPQADAIAEACRRLGDPRDVAREHARVRSTFGAKLTRTRAWSAAALLLPFAAVTLSQFRGALMSPAGFELIVVPAMLLALVARVPWARAIVFGVIVTAVGWELPWVILSPSRFEIAQLVAFAGAAAFLAPWRRGDLGRGGLALALLGPAYGAALAVLPFQITDPGELVREVPVRVVALAMIALAGAGGVARARWGAVAAAIASFALASTGIVIAPLTWRFPHGELWHAAVVSTLVIGTLGAATSAVIAWRAARSTFGSLNGVLG